MSMGFRVRSLCALVLGLWSIVAVCQSTLPGASAATDVASVPLTVEQVVNRLQENNAERAAALNQYEATRIYRMQYRGFPSNRDAEMVVNMTYHSPNSKQFSIVSETGTKFIIEHVFKKLLEGEQEASNDENRRHTALSTENYDFTWSGYEGAPGAEQYVLNLIPKTKNKFLYRGKIWVDAKDFAVVRIKGEPGKNPSFFIKRTDIEHSYVKIGDFWLPAENHTQSVIRLGGVATLTIEYKDYRVIKAAPLRGSKTNGEQLGVPQVTDGR
jgi:outer membrane lipoprotein-sorting protein